MNMKRIFNGLILLAVLMSLGACDASKKSGIKVLSTTGMIHDIVLNVAGDRIQSNVLMGAGVDPHLYTASQGDIGLMNEADLILYNGLRLEAKLSDLLKKMGANKRTVAVSQSIPEELLEGSDDYEDAFDPHIWMDVSLWTYAVKEVTNALIELDPKNKGFYIENATRYIELLDELDSWVRESISEIPYSRRYLITAHDAFKYFGRAYGLEVRGIQGISTLAEASTQDIRKVTTLVVENQIPSIFIESSVPIRHVQALQDAVQAKGFDVQIGESLYTDALGDLGTKEGTYVGMLQHNVKSIVDGLK